jgi:hypothetical protein
MDEKYKFLRTNALIILAYIMIAACLVVTLQYSSIDDYAKSIVTLILGRFLGYIDQAYAFEFGTTRGSKQKDETISSLTEAVNQAPKPP